jgi:uncharacterized SAM-binding protein YcdF (DUF218 family)
MTTKKEEGRRERACSATLSSIPSPLFALVRKRIRHALLLSLALLLLLGVAGFVFAHQLLSVDNGDVHGDFMVVLGGGYGERPDRAPELFKAGVAPKIILTGAHDAVDNQRLLVNRGVPAEAIQLEAASMSTKQNAQLTIPLLRAAGAHRVILVTSWYHSRRSLNCFRHYAPDIQFYSRQAAPGTNETTRQFTRYVVSEYIKAAGYWVCYGVRPF